MNNLVGRAFQEEGGLGSLSNFSKFKMIHQLASISKTLLPPPLATRSGNRIPLIDAKRDYFKKSFYPNGIKLWNKLDPTLKQGISLGSFKLNIMKIFRSPKEYFQHS